MADIPRFRILFSNFSSSVLAADIEEDDTDIPLRPGDGVRFPQPQIGFSYFQVVIENTSGNAEVCSCVDRHGDVLVVQRAKENTTTLPFSAGSRVECRVTAEVLSAFMQTSDPVTDQTIFADGISANRYRNRFNENFNQINMGDEAGIYPYVGTDPVHGSLQVESDMPTGVILMWSGAINSIPPLWRLCNGSNGTPDLRDKFVRGAGNNFAVGAAKGDWGTRTAAIPGHNHTGSTSLHALTVDQMPEHAHRLLGHQPGDNAGGAFVEAGPNVSAITVEVANNMFSSGGGAAHDHTISFDGRNDAGILVPDVSPTYYTLAFIMKVG